MTPLERAVLENVKAGRLAVHGLGEGKVLARAQHAIVRLFEVRYLRRTASEDPLAHPFVVTPAGIAALGRS